MFRIPRLASLSATVFILASSSFVQAQDPLVTYVGGQENDRFGWALAKAGDMDQDGVPDYLVGALFTESGNFPSGRVELRSGKTGAKLRVFEGDPGPAGKSVLFGIAVAGGADIDGDGTSDIVVGDHLDYSDPIRSGKVWIYSGKDGSVIRTLQGISTEYFGYSVAIPGDVNSDGHADVLVGAPHVGWANAPGYARLHSGKDGSVLYHYPEIKWNDWFGRNVSAAGDVDADGTPDFMVAARNDDTNGFATGKVIVYSGKTGSVIHTILGQAGTFFGSSLDAAGDLNNDGFADIVVGAPGSSLPAAGKAFAHSGLDGALLFTYSHSGYPYGTHFGASVAGAGDVNADGVPDVLVGAPYEFGSATSSGQGTARIFSGLDGSVLFTKLGSYIAEEFGRFVLSPGDLNGDGRADFLVHSSNSADDVMFGGTSDWDGKISVFSGCPGIVASYGVGCPGSGGFVPTLISSDCATQGNFVSFQIHQGLGGAAGIVFLGAGQATLPLPNGCVFRVDPILNSFPVVLTGAGPGAGTASFGGTIPMTVLSGAELTLQAFVFDPGALGGYAGTNAVKVAIAGY